MTAAPKPKPTSRTALYPQEVAERCGLSTQHIFDLIDEGQLRAVDFAGCNNLSARRTLRIPLEAWRAFMDSRAVVPTRA